MLDINEFTKVKQSFEMIAGMIGNNAEEIRKAVEMFIPENVYRSVASIIPERPEVIEPKNVIEPVVAEPVEDGNVTNNDEVVGNRIKMNNEMIHLVHFNYSIDKNITKLSPAEKADIGKWYKKGIAYEELLMKFKEKYKSTPDPSLMFGTINDIERKKLGTAHGPNSVITNFELEDMIRNDVRVSDKGNIFMKGVRLDTYLNRVGTKCTVYKYKMYYTKYLVCKLFGENVDECRVIGHIDGDPTNTAFENLKLMYNNEGPTQLTYTDNMIIAICEALVETDGDIILTFEKLRNKGILVPFSGIKSILDREKFVEMSNVYFTSGVLSKFAAHKQTARLEL